MYLAGYRVAMIVSGAGSLWLASHFSGSIYQLEVWKNVYQIISLFMLIGLISTFFAKEPLMLKKNNIKNFEQIKFTVSTVSSIVIFFIVYLSIPAINELNYFLSFLLNLVKILLSFMSSLFFLFIMEKINFLPKKQSREIFIGPILDFFSRYKKIALFMLLLIGLYRIADVVMGVMANIFYLEKGYEIKDIATYSKFFGLIATIIGGFWVVFFQ
jgi:PAT family beta-lactamase induction signal transducer AmpG